MAAALFAVEPPTIGILSSAVLSSNQPFLATCSAQMAVSKEQIQMFGYLMPGLSATHKRPRRRIRKSRESESEPAEEGQGAVNRPLSRS